MNDRAVVPLEFSLDSERLLSEAQIKALKNEVMAVEPLPMGYVEVNKKELAAYIGYKIRVYNVAGRMRQGIFIGERKGSIEMASEKYGRKMGMSVSVFSTERVEVYK